MPNQHIIVANSPGTFETKVNQKLAEGGWEIIPGSLLIHTAAAVATPNIYGQMASSETTAAFAVILRQITQ